MTDTDFGNQKISFEEKTKKVDTLFNTVSSYYDLMNDILSFGLHRFWKKKFVAAIMPKKNDLIADLACGTGDITLEILKASPKVCIHLIDPSPSMLRQARLKIAQRAKGLLYKKDTLSFHQLWAENLTELQKYSFHKVVCAFGFRNMTKKEKALKEIFTILKTGGSIHLLEFSKVDGFLEKPYELYRDHILPSLGEMIGDRDSYEYLAQSIKNFWTPEKVCEQMRLIGFKNVKSIPFSQGICHYFYGEK